MYCKTCGIIIKNSSIKEPRRMYCKYCYKQENKKAWDWKKDLINEIRRPLRRLEQRTGLCICCNKEYTTAREKQVTCGDDKCQKIMKNTKAKIKRRGLSE